ncbi:MAG: DUF1549 domain-containing protein, partial [Planctomycetaceae bacterium]|nr:DUF1549 domain-containing protein [Planctomycetaceae bacterium]
MTRLSAIILSGWLMASCGVPNESCADDNVPRDGLVLWLDASQINAADGTAPDVWRDSSGLGNDLAQEKAERRPTWHASAIGNRPAFRFDGNDLLQRAEFTGLATGDQLLHVLFVMRAERRENRPSQRLFDLNSRTARDTSPEPRRGLWVGIQDSRQLPRLGIQQGDQGEALHPCWDGQSHLLEAVYTGEQTFEMHVDGRRARRALFNGTHFLGLQPHVSLALGQDPGQEENESTFFVGDIAEVLIYSRPLSQSERYAVGTALADKYGLQTEFPPLPRFEADVRPILASHCFECHGEETQEAGLDLRTVSDMLRGGIAGPVIVRGHPDYSELVAVIEGGKMPPDGADPLTADELQLLRNWIEADAPADEKVEVSVPQSKVTEQDRRHWAYQMPVAQRAPEVKFTDRVRTPIDRFILAKLEPAGLSLSPDLAAESLVRRVTFDLIGLPPA